MKFKFSGKMFKSRNFVVFALLLMLVVVGTANYYLSQQSFLKTSNELKEYEKNMMENYAEDVDKNLVKEGATEVKNQKPPKADIKVVDSNSNKPEEKVKEASANITTKMNTKSKMQKETYIIDMKLNREKQRGELSEELDAIINNPSSNEKSKDAALNLKLDIIKFKECENKIENLLSAKGFDNPIVYLSKSDANVVVQKDDLSKQDVAKIFDVVNTETKLPLENIKIMQSKR